MNDERRHYRMVDVGGKQITRRRAIAAGRICMNAETFAMVRDGTLPKGDPLRLAEVAGVVAAKKAPEIIPLCHPLGLDQVAVAFRLDESAGAVEVFCQTSTSARTGVEMEALAGVNGALLTIWDLAKQVQADLAIDGVRLLLKEGGKSGRYVHPNGVGELPEGFGS